MAAGDPETFSLPSTERFVAPADPLDALVQVAELKTAVSRNTLTLARIEDKLDQILAELQARPNTYPEAEYGFPGPR